LSLGENASAATQYEEHGALKLF